MKSGSWLSGSYFEQPAALFGATRSGLLCGALALAAVFSVPETSLADEGGVSFWLPGFYGSLAAAPQQPAGRSRTSFITPMYRRAAPWRSHESSRSKISP